MSKTNAWDDEKSSQKGSKTLTPDTNNIIVKIIEDDTIMLHETLGITKKDSKRLQDIIYDQLKADSEAGVDKSNTSTLMVKISKECTHVNQLAFACFALGKITSEIGKEYRGKGSIAGAIGVNRKTGEIKHFGGDDSDLPDFLKEILKDILKGKKGPKGDELD